MRQTRAFRFPFGVSHVAHWRVWSIAALALLTLAGCGGQAGAWRLIGPEGGANAYIIVADPHVSGLVYAGADDGGVYRARADQAGDVVSGSGIPSGAAVASLAPDPQRAGVVLAGTSVGLYRSADYGDTWRAWGSGLPHASAVGLAMTPDDATLLAGIDHGGVYRSVDGGATWVSAAQGLPPKATPVALLWDAPARLWLAGLIGGGATQLYASADDGRTWTPRATGLPASAQVNALAMLSGAPALFAATTSGLYVSADAGQNWRHVAGLPAGSALALATLPHQPTWLYASVGAGVYRSTDSGATWQVVAPGLTSEAQGIAVTDDPQGAPVVYVAAGQVARYPTGATPVGSVPTTLLLVIFALALVAGGYLVSRRMRRFGYAMGARRNESNTGRAAEAAERWSAEQAERHATLQARHARDAASSISAPTRPTTDAPADPRKAAQNGHGKRQRRR